MSNTPSEEGIKKLRAVIDRLSIIDEDAKLLRKQLAEREVSLKALEEETSQLARKVPELLQSMDLASSGNSGWEVRLVWALRELARQYRQQICQEIVE